MKPGALSLITFAVLSSTMIPASAGTEPAAESPSSIDAAAMHSLEGSETLAGYFFGKNNLLDADYDSLQQWKKDYHLPISIGANHWWHVDRDERVYGNGYGVPGEKGTYYYSLQLDPALMLPGDGFFHEIGLHFQGRIRDSSDKLRSFYEETYWSYEAYAYAKTDYGTFSAGQIALKFGYTWDNSWWEGVAYFDGYRFNPAYGLSWENSWKVSDTLSFDAAAQYFLKDDRVSGAIANADAESSLAGERNTFNLRIAPTWKVNPDLKMTLGVSALTREVKDPDRFGSGVLDDRQNAWSVDGAINYKNFTIFSQYIDSHGAISPARYVSGGPSDRQDSVEVGLNYKFGPISPHLNFSKGWDHNPGGQQYIFNPGITFQVAKALTVYAEYVKWDVTNSAGNRAIFDDGFEFIAVWNF